MSYRLSTVLGLCASAAILLAWTAPLRGGIILTTINHPTPEMQDLIPAFYGNGPYISGSGGWPGITSFAANAFTLEDSDDIGGYWVESIDAALSLSSGPNQVTLALMSDAGGLPSQLIGSRVLTNAMSQFVNPSLVTANFGESILLEKGRQYWLAAFPGSVQTQADLDAAALSTTVATWHYNYDPEVVYDPTWDWYDVYDGWRTGTTAWHDGSRWRPSVPTEGAPDMPPNHALNAFEIRGTAFPVEPVPEPACAAIACAGLLLLAQRRRR